MEKRRSVGALMTVAGLAAAAWLVNGTAHAGDVYWTVGVSNAPPMIVHRPVVVTQPAYGYQPQVVVRPRVLQVVQPQVVYAPAPYYASAPYYVEPRWRADEYRHGRDKRWRKQHRKSAYHGPYEPRDGNWGDN